MGKVPKKGTHARDLWPCMCTSLPNFLVTHLYTPFLRLFISPSFRLPFFAPIFVVVIYLHSPHLLFWSPSKNIQYHILFKLFPFLVHLCTPISLLLPQKQYEIKAKIWYLGAQPVIFVIVKNVSSHFAQSCETWYIESKFLVIYEKLCHSL